VMGGSCQEEGAASIRFAGEMFAWGGGLKILPRISGGGGPRVARWRGASEASFLRKSRGRKRGGCAAAPPPPCGWSPSPAKAGEDC
jgi:hypothetical protein